MKDPVCSQSAIFDVRNEFVIVELLPTYEWFPWMVQVTNFKPIKENAEEGNSAVYHITTSFVPWATMFPVSTNLPIHQL